MDEKRSVTVLYDAAEDVEKAKAEEEGTPFPLAYAQVADALEKRGHKVKTVGVTKKIRSLVALVEKDTSDVIFNLCEAIACSPQHEHNVVGLLELYEKCFTGCGSAGWLLAGDKALCKKILQFHNIRYPRFCTFAKGKVEWSDDLEFPLIVKPLNEDASIGIDKGSVVYHVKELLERISYIQQEFDGATLVEEFIDGREIYVGVLGNDRPVAFPIIEWDFSKVKNSVKIAGTEAKWDRDSEGYKAPVIFPEDIPEDVVQGIQNAAITAYQALKLSGYSRVDMRLRQHEAVGEADAESPSVSAKNDYKSSVEKTASTKDASDEHGSNSGATHSREWDYPIIEVNPNCWIEKRSEFASAARKQGLSYPELLEKIIELALDRRPHVAP
jgi:D-alanine-D-alanine ligase